MFSIQQLPMFGYIFFMNLFKISYPKQYPWFS